MTDIEPAIRKALRPRIGNVERRTRYLLDAHAVAVAAALARERKRHDDAQRVMADDINRIAAERDEARETAANLATVWDQERETMAAHIGALEGELERVKDQAAEDVHALGGACGEIEALTAERDRLRQRVTVLEAEVTDAMLASPEAASLRAQPAAQTPVPSARSAPRGRRAARTGPGKGAEAAEAPGAAESRGTEGEGFSA